MKGFSSADFAKVAENLQAFGFPKETWGESAAMLGAAALAVTVGGAALHRLMKSSNGRGLPEPNLADEIPFNFIDEDGVTVDCDRSGCFSVVELAGVIYANLTDDEKKSLGFQRRAWLTRVAQTDTDVMCITSRRRMSLGGKTNSDDPYLKAVNERWLDRFSDALVNRNFVVISGGARKQGRVKEARDATVEQLSQFSPRVLRHAYDDLGEVGSELFDFLSWLINERPSSVAPHDVDDLATVLAETDISFDAATGLISQRDINGQRFSKIIGLKEVPQQDPFIVQALTRHPVELDVYQWLKPISSGISHLKVSKKKKNALMIWDSPIEREQYDEVDKVFLEGSDAICEYEMSVVVHGATPEEVDEGVATVVRVLGQKRFAPVIERTFCEEAFFSRLPGRRVALRKWEPNISNAADWTPFEGTARGLSSCGWGPSGFRELRTLTGTPYSFGVHESADPEAAGNGILVGATGKGKSVFMAWLLSGALTNFPGARVITFDNGQGLRIPTEAFGGKVVSPGTESTKERGLLAPLQLADTSENREFLTRILLEMSECEGPENEGSIADGLDMFMQLEKEERTLPRFYDECFHESDAVAVGLRQWIRDGAYSGWFDGDRDLIDVDSSNWITFNLQRVASNPKLAGVFTSYILHLIKTVVWRQGRPHFIFMDEASALIAASDLFEKTAAFLFREIRKHKGVFWVAFQEGMELGQAEAAFVKNATNYVFLRDPNANADALRELYEVSANGARFIRNEDEGAFHVTRGVLHVRKTADGKVETPLDINLGGLGEYLNLFRSSDEHVLIQQRFKGEYGEKWVGPYLQEVESLSEQLQSVGLQQPYLAAE